ncbi:MAG: hypothetical protein ACRDBG_21455, partial [Waterburya sp.]
MQEQEVEIADSNFSKSEVEELCKKSLDFLAGISMPTVIKYLFPAIFHAIWSFLVEHIHKVRDFSKLAIGFPRGFGKTMFIKLFIGYALFFTKKKFILIIAGTHPKAVNIIADIISVLNEPNIKRIFGDWKLNITADRQEFKEFVFRGRKIILAGAGALSDIRGITRNNARPDLIIFDDIQTREEADSSEVSKKLENWMFGTAMKAKSPEGCLFVFIANMYPTKFSLLKKLKRNSTWTKFIVGGILADGTSLWEELQPISQLLEEFKGDMENGTPEIFYAEVLNDEDATVNHLIDLDKIPSCPYSAEDIPLGSFI